MKEKEAKARIKINQLLRESGWRFFDSDSEKANIQLEPNVKIKKHEIDEFGKYFEKICITMLNYFLFYVKIIFLVVV